MIRILLIAALVMGTAAAQRPARKKAAPKPAAPAPVAERWPLTAIRVSGNKVFSSDAIIQATGLKTGEPVAVADLKYAVERLTDTGAFETLSYRYAPEGNGIAVTFEVQEVIDLYPVGFERLGVPETELMQFLSRKVPLFGLQIPATGVMVKRVVQALETCFTERGQPQQIVARVIPAPSGKLTMTFLPAEAPPVITFVKFENSTVIRPVDLQGAFYQTAVGVPYTEERLQELLDSNIRPLFEEKGKLQVRFGPFRVEESKQPLGVEITVPVQEGDDFRFGKVRIEGNREIPEKDLDRLVRIEEEERANFAKVKQAASAIEALYRRNGFLKSGVTVDRKLDEKNKTVDVVFRVREGDRYLFRKLNIKGIDINAEAAVRRRWGLQHGQPFDATYPEVFLKRIEEEAMFEGLAGTAVRTNIDEEAKMVDVELEFKGEPPKSKTRGIPR